MALQFLLYFFLFPIIQISGSVSKIDELNADTVPWLQFYENYIKTGRSIVLKNGCTDNKAYRLWSPDYILRHPGAALTYPKLTNNFNASLREFIRQRNKFEGVRIRVPYFLSDDLILPKCIQGCGILTKNINFPLWFWQFEDAQLKTHVETSPQLWCVFSGSMAATFSSKWTDSMINRYFTEKNQLDFPEVQFYKSDIKSGDCFFVPADFLRQYHVTKDTMAIYYDIPKPVLEKLDKELIDCKKGDQKSTVEFADDDFLEEGTVKHSHELGRIISYLGNTDCIDSSLFFDSIINDPHIIFLNGIPTREKISKEIFASMDRDHDEQFCWTDVDKWNLEIATELSQLMKSKSVVLQSALQETNRKAAKTIERLGVDWKDPRFLEAIWEEMAKEYGRENVGKIFDGPWLRDQGDKVATVQIETDTGKKQEHVHAEF